MDLGQGEVAAQGTGKNDELRPDTAPEAAPGRHPAKRPLNSPLGNPGNC